MRTGTYKLIAYSTSPRGETRLKQNSLSGNYCVEFNSERNFGPLAKVWPDFKLTKGFEVRYIGVAL